MGYFLSSAPPHASDLLHDEAVSAVKPLFEAWIGTGGILAPLRAAEGPVRGDPLAAQMSSRGIADGIKPRLLLGIREDLFSIQESNSLQNQVEYSAWLVGCL
jgi:hypothetical protein